MNYFLKSKKEIKKRGIPASLQMMRGLFPPSSNVTRFKLLSAEAVEKRKQERRSERKRMEGEERITFLDQAANLSRACE